MKIAFWLIAISVLTYGAVDAITHTWRQDVPVGAHLFGFLFAILFFGPLLFLSVRALIRTSREFNIDWTGDWVWQAGLVIGALASLKSVGDLFRTGASGPCFELNPSGPITMERQRYVYADCPGPNTLTDITLPALLLVGSIILVVVSLLRLRASGSHINGPGGNSGTGAVGA